MWFVGLGLVMGLLKLMDASAVRDLSWWVVLAPFGLAVVWWVIADQTGLTQRRAARQEAERARQRRERQHDQLGLRAKRGASSRRRG